MKASPENYEAGDQLVIQWDIYDHRYEHDGKSCHLYLSRKNNTPVHIGDLNGLSKDGQRFQRDRGKVSLKNDRVIVTIYELQYNDNYQFTVRYFGEVIGEIPSTGMSSFTVKLGNE